MPDDGARMGARAAAWAREFSDPDVLAAERGVFGQATWQLLGMASDIARHHDWFTATLSGRSVFVQRFRDRIVAFENICAHRFFPLRTEPRGHGEIRCGFHGWLYNKDGRAVGVPMCEEFYGCTAEALDRRLKPVEVALCGNLIFARPAEAAGGESLDDYLGATALPARVLTEAYPRLLGSFSQVYEANWKAAYHLSLDDYHIVATHPETFGANGAVKEGQYRYFELGRHSSLFVDHAGVPEAGFGSFAQECAVGLVSRTAYRILQIFPNLTVFLCPLDGAWFVCVADYLPTTAPESLSRVWVYGTDTADDPTRSPERAAAIVAFIQRVWEEDRIAAEGLQRGIHQGWRAPALCSQERRIAWFDGVYADLMEAG